MKKRIPLGMAVVILGMCFIGYANSSHKKIEDDSSESSLTAEGVTAESIAASKIASVSAAERITEINEERYVPFVNDAYANPMDYVGQQFRVRGHYRTRPVDGKTVHYIFQGTDERWVGFEIDCDAPMPKDASIILVVGTMQVKTVEGMDTPYLVLSSLEVIR